MLCKMCGSDKINVLYDGRIRDGRVGNYTDSNVKIYECRDCSTIWHDDINDHKKYYETEVYRKNLEGTSDTDDFYIMHDIESFDKFTYTGTAIYRNKVVADIGCGGGAFLDYINTVAKKVIAVEPSEKYRQDMRKRGIETFPYASEALKEHKHKIDIIVSFDVIEHVENPEDFFRETYDLLSDGGVAYIGTPTDAPVMREIIGEKYEQFLFSTQHPWVLREGSFDYMAKSIGIKDYSCKYYQRYGLGNLLYWIKENKPGKHREYDFISKSIDLAWKASLEEQRLADYIVFEMYK